MTTKQKLFAVNNQKAERKLCQDCSNCRPVPLPPPAGLSQTTLNNHKEEL